MRASTLGWHSKRAAALLRRLQATTVASRTLERELDLDPRDVGRLATHMGAERVREGVFSRTETTYRFPSEVLR
jgi:hypothetical protein